MDYLQVANSPWLWLSTIPVVLTVAIQAILFVKRAIASAPYADLSGEDARKAFRVGATAAIGPALGVFVVMVGLMAAIGGPLAWQRLSIIGAAPTELAAASMAAKAMNVELGGTGYGIIHFANAAWVMALNRGAWLLSTALLTDKLEKVTERIAGTDTKKVGLLGTGAMLGAMGFLLSSDIKKGLVPDQGGYIACAAGAVVAMIILEQAAKKIPKLTEFNLGIAMLVGMLTAVVYNNVAL